jgi:hypothetical protein
MAKSTNLKNPLAICWGMVLRNVRESRSWEYADIERLSGISQDFYRNIERAVFNLHVSQAIPLYNTFRNDVMGTAFSLDGIIHILSVISILEVRANDRMRKLGKVSKSNDAGKQYYASLEETFIELAEYSNKIKKLSESFFRTNIFSIYEPSLVEKTIEENGIVYELEDFLVHYSTYGESDEPYKLNYLSNFFDNVPSVYTDFLSETKRNLLGLPVTMIFSELQKWEKNNESKIKELYVLHKSRFDISKRSNLENYHYTYLFKSNFERARFLVIDPNLSSTGIKSEFDETLLSVYKDKNYKLSIPKNWNSGLLKIQFMVLPELTDALMDILTIDKGTSNEIEYECFWVFKFVDDTLVAFVANATQDPDSDRYIFYEGRSLFIKEIADRYPIIKSFFPN